MENGRPKETIKSRFSHRIAEPGKKSVRYLLRVETIALKIKDNIKIKPIASLNLIDNN